MKFILGVVFWALIMTPSHSQESVTGSYTQTRSTLGLVEASVQQGQFLFDPNIGLLWCDDTDAVFSGTRGETYTLEKSGWKKSTSRVLRELNKITNAVVLDDRNFLQKRFNIQEQATDANWERTFSPTNNRLMRIIKEIQIVGEDSFLNSFKITNVNGEVMELTFDNQRTHRSINTKLCREHTRLNHEQCSSIFSKTDG